MLLEVLHLSNSVGHTLADIKRTQKTVGILLYKLGQMVSAQENLDNHQDPDHRRPSRSTSRSGHSSASMLNFSAVPGGDDSNDDDYMV